jgi:hypothetical protein
MLINNPEYNMPSGPNLDLYSVFYEYSEGGGYENMKISRHIGIGDIETHTDRPRYLPDSQRVQNSPKIHFRV